MIATKNNPVRCVRCRMHIDLCICDIMPRFDLTTRITLIMQNKEFSITSNTGHYIPKILSNAEIRFRGSSDRVPLNATGLDNPDYTTLVLYPDPQARVLDKNLVAELKAQAQPAKPVHLIIPDGSWRQARKIIKRTPFLFKLPKVILPLAKPSNYRLRKSPRADGVCTFEAIALALGILESPAVQETMEYFFTVMVERVLWTRNLIEMGDVLGWTTDCHPEHSEGSPKTVCGDPSLRLPAGRQVQDDTRAEDNNGYENSHHRRHRFCR